MADETPKIHIDDDWKAQAQQEKQKLSEQSKAEGEGEGAGGREMPPADFQTLISSMATQALFAMGAIPDPQTGQRVAILDLARHHIDLLGVLEEKTKGNLSDDEQKMLSGTLHELRSNFTHLAQAAVKQQAERAAGGADAAPGSPDPNAGGAGPIRLSE